MTVPPERTLILGIGNPLMGDDGAGIMAARMLAESKLPDNVKVLEAGTGRPLAGAKVQGRDNKGTTKIETDSAGMAHVKVWRNLEYISVVVTCAGHVGQMATWSDEAAGRVPGQQAFRLEKGGKPEKVIW